MSKPFSWMAQAGLALYVASAHAATPATRLYSVADDIATAYFGDPYSGLTEAMRVSPNGDYVAVETQRGRLDLNRAESTLYVYRLSDVKAYLARPEPTKPPPPWRRWSRASRDGPTITGLRWLSDSSGLAFLTAADDGSRRLCLADLATGELRFLTPPEQDVTSFDILDSAHYIYTAHPPKPAEQAVTWDYAVTGQSLEQILFPEDTVSRQDRDELWAFAGERRWRVIDAVSRQPIHLRRDGRQALTLSPDGRTLATILPVSDVPSSWERLYPPPYEGGLHVHAGRQDLENPLGGFFVSRYVLIDLAQGRLSELPLGPYASEIGWWAIPHIAWSSDGSALVVSDAFLKREAGQAPAVAPCIAIVRIAESTASCLDQLKGFVSTGAPADGYYTVRHLKFIGTGDRQVAAGIDVRGAGPVVRTYTPRQDGSWGMKEVTGRQAAAGRDIGLFVEQDMNHRPVLVAVDEQSHVTRPVLDPNVFLDGVRMGSLQAYTWKDRKGRDFIGGLFLPPGYVHGRRYPLVIQTHGFSKDEYEPSGIYPTAFAARALAAAGMIVLQVRDCAVRRTADEGPCQVGGYEAGAAQLVAQGFVDPDRIGIVGFSRTCYYVLEALTSSSVHFEAASITDGVDEGYLQYVVISGEPSAALLHDDANLIFGGRPFAGEALDSWVHNSPEFNIDRVHTPLMVTGSGRYGLLLEWEPYANLVTLGRPAELVMLAAGTHVLTNPGTRLASQGGTVDWMRFWLQGVEDPDPTKASRYRRWENLCRTQKMENPDRLAFCTESAFR